MRFGATQVGAVGISFPVCCGQCLEAPASERYTPTTWSTPTSPTRLELREGWVQDRSRVASTLERARRVEKNHTRLWSKASSIFHAPND